MNKYFALSLLIGMALEGSNNPLIKDEAFYDNGNKNIKDTIKMEKQMESGLIGMRVVILGSKAIIVMVSV